MSAAIAPARRLARPALALAPAARRAQRAVIVAAIEGYERASGLHRGLEAEFEEGGDEAVGFFADLACRRVVDAEIALLNALLAVRGVGEPAGARDDYHARLQRPATFRHRGLAYRAVPDAGWGTMVLEVERAPGRGR